MSSPLPRVMAHSAESKCAVLSQVFNDYMEQTSLHGYRYLTEPGRHWFERTVWVLVQIAATAGVIWQVYTMYIEYAMQAPITTVQSMHYHVSMVAYPAVAVCDINKIRLSNVQALAEGLIRSYGLGGISQEELTNLLRYLGRMYDFSTQGLDQITRLDKLFRDFNVTLNYSEEMQRLGTSCDQLLLACKWEGRVKNCNELFRMRKTMEGYCCTFNYIRPSDNFDQRLDMNDSTLTIEGPSVKIQEKKVAQSLSAGPALGLTLVVSSDLSQYFYPLLPTSGIKLLVFNPNDYPDTASGGLIEKLVRANQEMFFKLSAVTTEPTEDVRFLPMSRRKCRFIDELSGEFTRYSYSDCLMECRVKSIRSLCGCLPFFNPMPEKDGATRVCEIGDVPCLSKHIEMWQTLRPSGELPGLELEMTQSLDCSNCLPACGDTAYSVQTTYMPLQQILMDHSMFLKGFNAKNCSVFHLYFGTNSQTLMRKSVLMAWHDLLSNIGGICGVFVGFSVMSLIEFLYFFTLRIVVNILGRRDSCGPAARHGAGLGAFRGSLSVHDHLPDKDRVRGLSPPHGLKHGLGHGQDASSRALRTPTTAPAASMSAYKWDENMIRKGENNH